MIINQNGALILHKDLLENKDGVSHGNHLVKEVTIVTMQTAYCLAAVVTGEGRVHIKCITQILIFIYEQLIYTYVHDI